jgi:alcohol dehydrogenase class IV
LSFALGAGATAATAEENAVAAAVASLGRSVGMKHGLADFGITSQDFDVIAADALDDEVISNAPLTPTATDITRMLVAVA